MGKRKINDYFNYHSDSNIKKSASVEREPSNSKDVPIPTVTEIPTMVEHSSTFISTLPTGSSEIEENIDETSTSSSLSENLPLCWSKQQGLDFLRKYPWLVIKEKKLGCRTCRDISQLGAFRTQGLIAPSDSNWSNINIASNGEGKFHQQKSLRKKICEHKLSKSHIAAEKIHDERDKEQIKVAISFQRKEEQIVTERIFRTAYHLAKQNKAFYEFEKNINLQILNGLDMGKILHSNVSAMNIVNHISQSMQKSLSKTIVDEKLKFSLILDESTSLSNISCLILYLRTQLSGMENPVNLFLSLKELQETNANGLLNSLLSELDRFKIDKQILREHLIAVTCDGASVMLGKKSGLCKMLLDMFPDIIIWHCLNHRLELSVGDTIKLVAGINSFKNFIDKLRNLYHNSPKNQRELNACAANTGQELMKIGRVLDIRWAASSLRAVKAVWNDYPSLYEHFIQCSTDNKRDAKEKATFSGLAKNLATSTFVLNLGIMYDALEELSSLSQELQNRQTTLVDAHRLIRLQLQVFESRMVKPGKHASEALEGATVSKFKNVSIQEGGKSMNKINPGQFYRCLADSIESRMFSVRPRNIGTDYKDFINEMKVLNPKFWPNAESIEITYGEDEIMELSRRFHLDERKLLMDFRIFKDSSAKEMRSELKKLISIVNCIPVSSAECERGFSTMNLICTPQRTSLNTKTLSNLMFIRLVGPSLEKFQPESYVRSWIESGHHSAIDNQSKKRKEKDENPDMLVLWNIFH